MKEIIKLLRIKQWSKNLVIFIPIFFAGKFLDTNYFLHTFWAFIAFSLLSSSIYVINDITDAQRDKKHPVKRNRPIPSGKISIRKAWLIAALTLLLTVFVTLKFVASEYFLLIMGLYATLMLSYSYILKHIGVVDSIVVAAGFVLRAVAGAILLELSISGMLLVTIIGGAILISFGKRKAEIAFMSYEDAVEHRPALSVYPKGVLDSIISAISAVTFSAYVLFAYSYELKGFTRIFVEYLPPKFRDPQWLLITIPFAFYILARYLILIYKGESKTPEDIWFVDAPLRNGILILVIMLFLLIYLPQLLTMM